MEKPILESFTMRGKTYQIKKRDYILYNGGSYQFCTGDGRILYHKNWINCPHITLTKKATSEMPLDQLEKAERVNEWGMKITEYYF